MLSSYDPFRIGSFHRGSCALELHLALQKAGLVEDINYGINTLKAAGGRKILALRENLHSPVAALDQKAWLVFDQLDLNAVILLNGERWEPTFCFRSCRSISPASCGRGEHPADRH